MNESSRVLWQIVAVVFGLPAMVALLVLIVRSLSG
jgi:hypothetical protein